MVGVSNAPWGVIDTNRLLLKDGVGLLTAGGGPSGGVGCRVAGDVVGARRHHNTDETLEPGLHIAAKLSIYIYRWAYMIYRYL